MQVPIRYDLDLSRARNREIDVKMTVDLPGNEPVDVVMPHLSPGSPTNSLNHDARIRGVKVSDAQGDEMPFTKLREGGYRIERESRGPVVVRYTVEADTFSHVRANLTEDYAYVNGPAVAMIVRGHEQDPSIVALENLPDQAWQSQASLPKVLDQPHAFYAPTYQDLADTNLFAGHFDQASAEVEGTQLTVNVHGTPPWEGLKVNGASAAESLQDLTALYKTFLREFGKFPTQRYTHAAPLPAGVDSSDKYFLNKHYLHNGKPGAGGYEHYHGHELLLSSRAKAGIAKRYDSDGRAYERGIMAHELIHKLLAKFVTHDGIDCEDLTHIHKTDGLWLTEGTTEWAGKRLELLAGLSTPEQHLGQLERFFTRYLDDYAHNPTSPTDDSLDAHVGNSNYYNKGAVAATILELELRQATGGEKGFYDVLRGLKAEFGGSGRGFTLDDVERLTAAAAGPGAERIHQLFTDHLRDRKPFDLNASLALVGYQLVERRQPAPPLDRALNASTELPSLGLTLAPEKDGLVTIKSVDESGPARRAGLNFYQGEKARLKTGDNVVELTVDAKDDFTGRPVSRTFAVTPEPETTTVLEAVPNPSPEQLALRGQWLARQ
ncbi:MAG: hypothetical protein AB7S38_32785 [Vulcanimicrobiota bacterium]